MHILLISALAQQGCDADVGLTRIKVSVNVVRKQCVLDQPTGKPKIHL
ncbi:hypothetical protein BH10PSE19_BH10PSE19_11480 [soil metagenome]